MSRSDWVVLRGGPMDGWVYDLELNPRVAHAIMGATFTYEPALETEEGTDGLPVMVYRFTPVETAVRAEAKRRFDVRSGYDQETKTEQRLMQRAFIEGALWAGSQGTDAP